MPDLVKNLTNLTAAKIWQAAPVHTLGKLYKTYKKFDKKFVNFNYDFSLDKIKNLWYNIYRIKKEKFI